jgi:HEAT repeat protein
MVFNRNVRAPSTRDLRNCTKNHGTAERSVFTMSGAGAYEEWERKRRDDPRTTWELINTALTETNEEAAWEPVEVLHFRATHEVFDAARRLCASPCARERSLGADILGQLGVPERVLGLPCVDVLIGLLAAEHDENVLYSICIALGHQGDPRAIAPLSRWKKHPSAEVRYGVAYGLAGHDNALAVRTLIELSNDDDAGVRDWATFALGQQIDLDTQEIRDALCRRLDDSDRDARGEALVGLARRQDPRVIEPLARELRSDDVGDLAFEAAHAIADPRLLSALRELAEDCDDEDIKDAISRCEDHLA